MSDGYAGDSGMSGDYGGQGSAPKKRRRKKRREGIADLSRKALQSDAVSDFEIRGRIAKVDAELGLVFGWAIVTHEDGEPYFDLQGDHVTQEAMLDCATDFALSSRVVKDSHEGGQVGTVVHTMPLTDEVAEAFGIECEQRGLMIAIKPDEDVLEKFKSGKLTGFSIGGLRGEDEELDDDLSKGGFSEEDHPRVPPGDSNSGQFTSGGGGGGGAGGGGGEVSHEHLAVGDEVTVHGRGILMSASGTRQAGVDLSGVRAKVVSNDEHGILLHLTGPAMHSKPANPSKDPRSVDYPFKGKKIRVFPGSHPKFTNVKGRLKS